MMDQSRMRREAAAAAKAAAEADEAALPEANAGTKGKASPVSAAASADAALAKLLSGPALPFLSTDPAVAPRNGSCTRPTHLSLRRMKSVEVLGKIMRERRAVSSATTPSAQASGSGAVEVDTTAGQISPRLARRATPPKLTVSSPRGISSPKELALEGGEFEPASWSPARDGIIISNRRVAKKPRSRLRHAASGSDLRSAAAVAAEEASLETPSRSARRGRSKSRAADSARAPVAALLRDSVGTLSRGATVQALRKDVRGLDEVDGGRGGVDDSPTRMRMRNVALRKDMPAARITRTSKIMRLIEDAENMPIIVANTAEKASLSSSLTNKSRDRMHAITRVLGQRQPTADAQPQPPLQRI